MELPTPHAVTWITSKAYFNSKNLYFTVGVLAAFSVFNLTFNCFVMFWRKIGLAGQIKLHETSGQWKAEDTKYCPFVSKRDTFPQCLYWNAPFWRVSETLWMMVPGNTNGLFLLLPSTQEVVQKHTSFALEDYRLFLKKGRAVVGGRWVVGEKNSSYSDFFLDFRGGKTVLLYLSFILVFYPLTTLYSLPSEWISLSPCLFVKHPHRRHTWVTSHISQLKNKTHYSIYTFKLKIAF